MAVRLALQQRDVPAGFDEIFEGFYHLNADE